MDEILFTPILRVLLTILRVLQFLAWNLMITTIGWTIGWCFYRSISAGNFPSESLSDQYQASLSKALVVEFTGLSILAALIYIITTLI